MLAALLARARSGDWAGLEGDWAAFVSAFEARRIFEEEVLFPALCADDSERRKLAQRLVEEHEALQQLFLELGRQIRRKSMRETTIELATELLHDHATVESTSVDPWIDLAPRKLSLRLGRRPT